MHGLLQVYFLFSGRTLNNSRADEGVPSRLGRFLHARFHAQSEHGMKLPCEDGSR